MFYSEQFQYEQFSNEQFNYPLFQTKQFVILYLGKEGETRV